METEGIFLVGKGNPAKAFERRSFTLKVPKGTEVVVEVEAFGLNYADVMARNGLYREAPSLPCIIGYEAVGKVVSVGSDADQTLLNKRVLAFCRFGGYAKHLITNDYAVVPVEDQPAEELMALCTQAVTAYYMSEYLAPIHSADTILIHAAAGGVGTILIQLAKMRGATVIAKVGSDEKCELTKSLGADYSINYKKEDYATEVARILGGKKLDVSFNPVAGSTYKKDWNLIGSGGRMVLFGGSELGSGKWGIFSKLNFVRKMSFVLPIVLMIQSKNMLGVNMLRIADDKPEVLKVCLEAVVEMYKAGRLTPQRGGKFNVSEIAAAHSLLESGKSSGKISVFW